MNLPDDLLPAAWLWAGIVLYAALLLRALWHAPWWHLTNPQDANVWMGALVGQLGLWQLHAGVAPGLTIHQLGTTILYLMFGWELALLGVTLVLLVVTAVGQSGWWTLGCNALVMGAVPIMVSHLIFRAADRHLPNNFFVYIFVAAFLGGALAIAATGLASYGLLLVTGVYTHSYLSTHYLPFYLLMLFPEGFLSGMLMSIFVAYRPQWVSSFDDARYLDGK